MTDNPTGHQNQDIRWQQRFRNFEKAFNLLKEAMAIDNPTEVERAGLIQFFEMTFELSWKLLKDYLEQEGFTIKTPRQAIKQAYQSGLIDEGHTWIDALTDRNLSSHTYEEETAVQVENQIRQVYFPLLRKLHRFFADLQS